ncbi:adenylate kinase family protein [Rubritalea sp.]|uniref:adenylate kinase family protein n=1 Tax=Rubritalea sp. TaxID=2109375 RepID=UPI003EF9F76C
MANESNSKRPAILILGAPGSGKGTQGKALGMVPRFFHCACGDVFRSLDTRTELGKKFVEYSSKGQLVPDELTIQLWEAQIENWKEGNVYFPETDILILDGIPRNVKQAEILSDYIEVHHIFHLSCPDRSELARRMQKRALRENRIDDASETVIEDRIRTYEAETKPILEFYPDAIRTDIDATQQPIKVMHDIISKIVSLPFYEEMNKVSI